MAPPLDIQNRDVIFFSEKKETKFQDSKSAGQIFVKEILFLTKKQLNINFIEFRENCYPFANNL